MSNFQVNLKPKGNTVINHGHRTELKLLCDEYVIADYLYQLKTRSKKLNVSKCVMFCGFNQVQIQTLIESLKANEIITNNPYGDNVPGFSKKWYEAMQFSEEEFEELWKPSELNGIKFKWGDTKTAAKKIYELVRKKVSHEILMQAKADYFQYLYNVRTIDKFNRAEMGLSKFLGTDEWWKKEWIVKEISNEENLSTEEKQELFK